MNFKGILVPSTRQSDLSLEFVNGEYNVPYSRVFEAVLLAHGYLRKYKINPTDIANIIGEYYVENKLLFFRAKKTPFYCHASKVPLLFQCNLKTNMFILKYTNFGCMRGGGSSFLLGLIGVKTSHLLSHTTNNDDSNNSNNDGNSNSKSKTSKKKNNNNNNNNSNKNNKSKTRNKNVGVKKIDVFEKGSWFSNDFFNWINDVDGGKTRKYESFEFQNIIKHYLTNNNIECIFIEGSAFGILKYGQTSVSKYSSFRSYFKKEINIDSINTDLESKTKQENLIINENNNSSNNKNKNKNSTNKSKNKDKDKDNKSKNKGNTKDDIKGNVICIGMTINPNTNNLAFYQCKSQNIENFNRVYFDKDLDNGTISQMSIFPGYNNGKIEINPKLTYFPMFIGRRCSCKGGYHVNAKVVPVRHERKL